MYFCKCVLSPVDREVSRTFIVLCKQNGKSKLYNRRTCALCTAGTALRLTRGIAQRHPGMRCTTKPRRVGCSVCCSFFCHFGDQPDTGCTSITLSLRSNKISEVRFLLLLYKRKDLTDSQR